MIRISVTVCSHETNITKNRSRNRKRVFVDYARSHFPLSDTMTATPPSRNKQRFCTFVVGRALRSNSDKQRKNGWFVYSIVALDARYNNTTK